MARSVADRPEKEGLHWIGRSRCPLHVEIAADNARWGERLRQPTALLGAVMLGIQAAFLLGFAAMVVRARLHAGEWPHPGTGNPFDGSYRPSPIDPKRLGVHYKFVGAALTAVIYTAPIAAFAIAALIAPWARRHLGLALGLAATSAICALVLFADPFDFVLWFVD